MATTNSIRYEFEALRSLAFGSISGTYAGVGTAIDHPLRQFIVTNSSDVLLTFSFDGVVDHFVLLPRTQMISDVTTNKVRNDGLFLAEGERLYVKGSPTLGSVYFSAIFGNE